MLSSSAGLRLALGCCCVFCASAALRSPELQNRLDTGKNKPPPMLAAAAAPSTLPGEHSPVRILVVHIEALGRPQELCREKR